MTMQSKFGIYLNPKKGQVVRITSPYWLPEPPDWVYVTPEVNATLLQIREVAKEKKLTREADKIVWTQIPVKEEDRIRWDKEDQERKRAQEQEKKS